MRAAGQGRAPVELASALVDEVEAKKHRRDPFGDRYVALATSEFGGNAQDGGRAAVEAATTNVHVRVELIRSMKNALVKQTQEAVKRSTQLGPPPARQRLGTRARQAAAAEAADAADAEDQHAGEADSSAAAFFCDDLHQALEQLLSGGGLAPDAAASLAAAQEALGAGRDGTRLPPSDLTLPVEGELAPPPFDDLVQQLFGPAEDDSQQAATAAAPLPPGEAAGLAAAVQALQLHTAELESRGVLQVAGPAADDWLLPDGSSAELGADGLAGLPAYLHAAQPGRGGQPSFLAPVQQLQQQGPDSRFQHWPAPAEGAAAAEGHDAIQEADEAPDWGALEGEALLPQRRPALRLNLQAQRQGGEAAGGVLVSFDDDQPPQQQAWRGGHDAWHSGGQQQQQQQQQQAAGWQQGQQGQATLSDIWEAADGCADPWMDVEEADGHLQWQQQGQQPQPGQQVPPGTLRVPTFAPRPGRQQLALSHSQPQQQAAFADEGIDDEEWDAGMLEQVAALEQQALLERQQAQPGEQPSQPQGKRHVPVFRNRTFQQALPAGAWPAESIEDADSDEEGTAAAAAGQQQVAAAGTQRGGAVPQLGRRGALPLASQALAAGQALASDEEGGEEQQTAAAHTQQQRRGQWAPAAAGVAGGGTQPAVQVDFSAIDVESLRPSVLLRQQAGGRPKWRPVFDPEQLLLQPLRSALRPPPLPSAERRPSGSSHWQAAGAQTGPAAGNTASDLLAGITAADLEEWDDWGDEEAAAADGASFDGGGWDEAPGQWDAARHEQQPWQQQQQQQQQQPLVVGWDEPAVAPGQRLASASAPALAATAAAAPSPAAPAVRFQPLVELAFDYDEDDGGSQAEAQQEQSQPAYGASQPSQAQQQVGWASQGRSPDPGSTGAWPLRPDPDTSSWQQGFGWQQASQPQHSQLGQEPAAGGDVWAGLEPAADERDSQDQQDGQLTWQPEGAAAQHGCRWAANAASPAAADAADPWAALGGDEAAAAAADGWEGGDNWFSQQAAGAAESPAAAVVDMAADPPADACGGGSSFGGWALDVEWEDAGPAADEQPPLPARQQQRQPAGHAQGPSSSHGLAAEDDAAEAAAATSMEGALEWGYDEPEQATEAAAVGPAGSLAAHLAALGVLDPAVPAAAAAAAGKRRHEQIGAEIIQALLEERRRARVDLQPLLQQLSSRLAQALASGGGSGAGSSGTAEAAMLSAVRQACLEGGGPAVQASMQRYLVALLTAAHQHNSGAAAAAAQEAEGGCAAPPAAAVAPLAAALSGKQLLLYAPGGATDIQIAVA